MEREQVEPITMKKMIDRLFYFDYLVSNLIHVVLFLNLIGLLNSY